MPGNPGRLPAPAFAAAPAAGLAAVAAELLGRVQAELPAIAPPIPSPGDSPQPVTSYAQVGLTVTVGEIQ